LTPFDFQIDFRSPTGITTQIVEQVQSRVLSGQLRPGDQLPTVRQLAADLRVNFNTVARAYRILDDLGLISTQQGRGTYIWEPGDPGQIQVNREQVLAKLAQHFLSDAAALGFSYDEVFAAFKRQLKGTAVQSDAVDKGKE